jgi:hypothetical protein
MSVAAMALYAAAMVAGLYVVGLWRPAMIKEAVLWFTLTAFAMVMRFMPSRGDERIFRSVFADNVRLVVVIEFLVGAYVLSLLAELVLFPIVTLLAMLDAFARLDQKHATVAKVTGPLLSIIGLVILSFAVTRAVADYRSLGTMDTSRTILFPLLMSIGFVPFVYGLVAFATYESVFTNLTMGGKKAPDVVRYAKRRIIFQHGLSLHRLRSFLKRSGFKLMQIESPEDVERLLQTDHSETSKQWPMGS